MLSECLQALADRLRAYKDTGLEMHPEAVRQIVALLDGLAEDARTSERPAQRVPSPWGAA